MSLKSRRALIVVLCLLSGLCLSTGYLLRGGLEPDGATMETTLPEGATSPGAPGEWEDIQPWRAWVSPALLILGAGLAAAMIGLFRQEKPLLGPEGNLCLLLLAGYTVEAFSVGMSSLPWVFCLVILALLSLENIVAWLRKGLPLEWLLSHRLAKVLWKKTKRYWLYPTCLLGILAVGVAGGGFAWGRLPMLSAAALLISAGALACLLNAFVQTGRLLAQIHRPEAPGSGLFQPEEELLLQGERRREEAVKQAVAGERFKVELIANVSHDLRTPLTAILGCAELLEKQPMTPEAAGWLSQLTRRAGYMRELVESLFELTKVSSGVAEAKREPLDLIRLLEQTAAETDESFRTAGLEMRRRYAVQSLMLTSDGGRLHRVFANLLENAVKYAMPGTRVYLEVLPREAGVEARLTNTAAYEMDFEPEEITRRFARGDTARTTEGSGLGLAIAQTYTESLDGKFHVEIDGDQFRAVVWLPTERDL